MSITKISPDVVDFDSGITISTADNLDTLTLTSTDADASVGPTLALYRNSSSPADSDIIGSIDFDGRNDNSQDVQYSRIISQIADASDGTEDATLYVQTIAGGTNQDRITIKSSETVFNEDSSDIDFRVESDGNANMLVVDGGKNTVAIGADAVDVYSSYAQLNIGSLVTIAGETASGASKSLQISHNAHLDTDGSWEAIATDEATNYYQHGGAHVFRSAAATTGGTDIAWTTAGQFNINGLCFGTDTAAANALDDYEEGSFTIGIDGGTIAAGNTTAYYVKVGQMVWWYWYSGGLTINSASGNATLTQLPFTSNSTGYTLFHYVHGNAVDGNSRGGYVNVSNTNAVFVDDGAVSLATYNGGSLQYIMVMGMLTTDS